MRNHEADAGLTGARRLRCFRCEREKIGEDHDVRKGGHVSPEGAVGRFGTLGSHGQSGVQPPSDLDTSDSLSNGATPSNP